MTTAEKAKTKKQTPQPTVAVAYIADRRLRNRVLHRRPR